MAEPVTTPPAQPATPAAPAKKEKKAKKKGGCFKGCLISLLMALLLIGAAAALLFGIPQKMGWVKSAGAYYTDMTPERIPAQMIVDEAKSKGFKADGVRVFVFPKPDSGDAVLFASFDFSKGAALSKTGSYSSVVSTLVLLGGGKKAQDFRVTHLGAEFLDEQGNRLMEVGVSTADIRDLAAGKITEDEFKKKMAMKIDLPNYFHRAVIPF